MNTFLANKRKRPCEDVHEVGQPVWVGGTVELSDVHHIVLILQHRRLGEHVQLCIIHVLQMIGLMGNTLLLYTSR